MSAVAINSVTFAYSADTIIRDLSLTVEAGQIVCLVGPSGCGKSTLLRLIAGLESPSSGGILTQGSVAGANRDALRFLFQDYDAYPWYSVWDNVQSGSGSRPSPADQVVEAILTEVGLTAKRTSFPSELSGGMRKRLGLARCLVRQPSLLLLDEPFSSLDIDARNEMYSLVQRLWSDTGCAVILVTHDLPEAILLADRLLVSSPAPMTLTEVEGIGASRPRGESITETPEYLNVARRLRALLRRRPSGYNPGQLR
jgi:ABC-type nitrate/sulfonate/bicarbonate transport system ATPase subunit